MSQRILVIAPPGPPRERLERFFAERASEVVTLAREETVAGQALCIEDERVLWKGEDVIEGCAGAVVLDSGFMWPMPRLDPTPAQWQEHRGRFDDFLRDERETASIWLSLLEILNDRLPVSVNPQRAFMHEALKPAALDALDHGGVTLPPRLVSNDPEAVADFVAQTGEALWLPLSPDCGGETRWLTAAAAGELPLSQEPVSLQMPASREVLRVVAVEGLVAVEQGFGSARSVDPAIEEMLPTIHRTLDLPLASLVFRPTAQGWALSDFSPAPDLGELEEGAAQAVLSAVWQLIRGTA